MKKELVHHLKKGVKKRRAQFDNEPSAWVSVLALLCIAVGFTWMFFTILL